ncbi:glutamate synthase large subunit [Candidatus Saganbacteria bacterium]|nr:glutamate synthase large subunit [Candidatus Saganbacteria bacterium]
MHKPEGLYDPGFEHDACGVGFVADINGQKTHAIVRQGIKVLERLAHRGAVGADPLTGDGAGILIQLPHEFLAKVFPNITRPGSYGTGMIFFPREKEKYRQAKEILTEEIGKAGQKLLGWRKVPVNDSGIGETARKTQPEIEQVFIGKGSTIRSPLELEKILYQIRRATERRIDSEGFYITNLSARTMSYKGLLMPAQLSEYFPDLNDPDLKSALALVHSRYSTNTFPTWDLSQPFRFLAHNGEINTLRGNINWMKARGIDVIVPGGSDSAALDNAFELLVLSGRSLPHAMMMLIPAAWEQNRALPQKLRDFYKYHACFMEPWDGPAAVAFTDGTRIGAVLDRNGLRPARFVVTKQDLVVMASEVGVLDIPPQDIISSGRLEPGKIFFIDTEEKRIIHDEEIKDKMAARVPYSAWIKDNLVEFDKLTTPSVPSGHLPLAKGEIERGFKIFGYTREDMKFILQPMAEEGKEPVGSMGNDTPPAVLSQKPQLLYNYFKQLFAQVTNPAIDPIREELVMSLDSFVGAQKNILEETPEHCRKIRIKTPVLFNDELEKIRQIDEKGFKAQTLSLLFDAEQPDDFMRKLDEVCSAAEEAVKNGFTFIILSDRGVNRELAALPALLACGAVHHHLIRAALRTRVGIVVESGEPREVHHFALLFGFGADCINPYLAYEAVEELGLKIENYRHAVEKGILKILSKMGISTLNSYRGAQIFEALGLHEEVIEKCFTGTPSRIGGVTLDGIAQETIRRHQAAHQNGDLLPTGGLYQWKKDGEFHLWNPDSIAALQDSTRKNDFTRFCDFSRLIDDQSKNPATLRGLLKFKPTKPIPVDEVEPISEICKRFATGAMSYGSISRGAHETIARALNRIGGRSNTGEGGEDPQRFKDDRRSAVKQVASGRFGVNTNYLVNADEIQIKIAQGAKPGEGGQLPGHKVSATIAATRFTTPGVTLISPPPHHDIYSIEDLAQLIFDLKNVNPRARISVKLVSEAGVGTVAAGVAKGHADMILISGGDGGTGASPLSSIKHAGLPWELGLSETHQTLVLNDLRSRVRLQTDGQMRTGRDVVIAAILGAEEFGFATAPLIVMGCVMLRHCHLNNCSVGVATQDELLESRFKGGVEQVVNYFTFVARQAREILAELGIKSIDELIGRTDLLEAKAKGLDFSRILYRPEAPESVGRRQTRAQDHQISKVLDRRLIELAQPALCLREPVREEIEIKNFNRTAGAMLSGEVCKVFGEEGLLPDTIHFIFKGEAGQSFGAWLARGITFELEGMANDYVGKGVSGGKIIIYPNRLTTYPPGSNIIIGNTAFYGAISGEAYIRGVAGERFCIRNSGLNAVVEGVGDHGCEYMTGGRVVILGKTGRNFGAGMSGGIAYVYDEDRTFKSRCNPGMVELLKLTDEDRSLLKELLAKHHTYTGSERAKSAEIERFVKVMPVEYRKVLERKAAEEKTAEAEVSDG